LAQFIPYVLVRSDSPLLCVLTPLLDLPADVQLVKNALEGDVVEPVE
jgi:hypothetical protein